MACPFFMPVERAQTGSWNHPARLPLGCGWTGHCTAPGHDGETPVQQAIEQFCNLGYAAKCGNMPQDRASDAVRFGVKASERNAPASRTIHVHYVCERNHLPSEHGVLHFDAATSQWTTMHSDSRIQKMASCFLESYLEKTKSKLADEPAAKSN